MQEKTLYLNSSGPPVRALHALLRKYEPQLAASDTFSPKTERAVRAAQRKLGIFPADGLADPYTLVALVKNSSPPAPAGRPSPPANASVHAIAGYAASFAMATTLGSPISDNDAAQTIQQWIAGLQPRPAAVPPVLQHFIPVAKAKAQQDPMSPDEVANPAQLRLSEPGRQFVFRHEAGDGRTTSRLHHPAGNSGVTLGPGYDMKQRSQKAVEADLLAIFVDPKSAAAASLGSGLLGKDADDFVSKNKSLINLTLDQQVGLQRNYKGTYEHRVRLAIRIPLHQYEFDALVSFAGNPGNKDIWHSTARLVNEHQSPEAMAQLFRAIHTGNPKLTPGLRNRRTAEAKLFLYGDYTA